MFDNVLILLFYVMIILGLIFVASGVSNVLHRIRKNRRVNQEYRDQRQWENFSRRNR